MEIAVDTPARADVRALLDEHLADMYATSPAESVHALDHEALQHPSVTFFTARQHGELVGCAALSRLDDRAVELKSMRTASTARGRGVATALLGHLVGEAVARGYDRMNLETGTEDFFAPARRLYARHGFVERPPFGGYLLDPHSVYLTLDLTCAPPAASGDIGR